MMGKDITGLHLMGASPMVLPGLQGTRGFDAVAPRPVDFAAHCKYPLRTVRLAASHIAAPRAEVSSQIRHHCMMPANAETGGLIGKAIAATIDKLQEFAR
jgi:hypothetical protein